MNVQQRPVMSRSDLEAELNMILLSDVPGTDDGPNPSMIRKASSQAQRILRLIDRYATHKGA